MGDELGIAPLRNRPDLGELAVVVVHQAVGVTKPGETRDDFTQGIQEQIAVGIIAKNRLACIAAGGDVVNRTGRLDSQRAGHD